MGFNIESPKDMAAAFGPMLDELETRAVADLTKTVIPAVGAQLQAGIVSAVNGLNSDSLAAINALGAQIEKLVPELEAAGERLIAKFFSELKTVRVSLGG